ncbi:MAG: hypothetical protein DLM72_08885 [Candidatus Nitrosopolaris wilkensis]|nr:MAG: hypothetical protein DLM72_08885 [Candidatus Nitrosopolaris wilkensis]
MTLKSELERALEFERIAIKSYNDSVSTEKNKDHLTLGLLNAELKYGQDLEDILANPEIH